MELRATLVHLINYFILYPSISSKCLPNLELSQNHVTATGYTEVQCTITCPKSHKTSLQWKTMDGTVITSSALGARTRVLSPYTLQLEIPNRNLGTRYQCFEKYSGIQTWLHLCGTTSKDCDRQRDEQHQTRNKREAAETSDSKNDTETFITEEDQTTKEIPGIATSTTVSTTVTSKHTDKTRTENPSITTAKSDFNNTKTSSNEDKTIPVKPSTTDAPILDQSETSKDVTKTTTENKLVTSKATDLSSSKSEVLSTKAQTTSTVATTTNELKTIKDIRSNSNLTANSDEDINIAVETDLSRKYTIAMNTSKSDVLDPVEPIDKIHSETTDSETFKTEAMDQNPSSTPSFQKTFTEEDTTIGTGSKIINFENAKSTESTNVLTKLTPGTTTEDSDDEIVPALEASASFPLLAEGPPLNESPVNLEGDTTVQEPESTITTTPMLTLIATNPMDSVTESTESQTSTRQASVKDTAINNITGAGNSTTVTVAQTTSEGITKSTETETTTQTVKTSSQTKQSVDTTSSPKTTETTGGEASDVTTDMLTQTNKLKTTTQTKNNGSSNKSEGTDDKDSEDSMFGKYGLPMFAAAAVLALILLFVIIYLCLKQKRKGKEMDFMTSEKNAPKLKMLEVRNPSLTGELKSSKTAPKDDGLQTYSLDYEKHVQQKIEEHRQLVKRKSLNSSLTAPDGSAQPGVSSFKIPRKPSAESGRKGSRSGSQSGPTSPVTPTSPEGKPLLPREDEPIVFNFAKKPGEATAARRGSALDAVIGQRPNSGNPKKTTKPDDYYV